MALLSNVAHDLLQRPRLLARFPPYFCAVLVAIGLAWVACLPLPLDSSNSSIGSSNVGNFLAGVLDSLGAGGARSTYISENALLPGQVHTYFSGSEQNVVRAYRRELDGADDDDDRYQATVAMILREAGLKVATQDYEYRSPSSGGGQGGPEVEAGRNVYGILRAPRGDATEAVVLVAGRRTVDGRANANGVALLLGLARYFARWSLWAKDIIFLVTPDSRAGAQAWVDAYHDAHTDGEGSGRRVQPLPLKSGVLQGALVVEYAFDHRFEALRVVYDGVNGQLPNLDLVNIAVLISGGQMGIPAVVQDGNLDSEASDGGGFTDSPDETDSYTTRLRTMASGMVWQGLGYPTGMHGSFIPYRVDSVTLVAVGNGWQDEMALGRTVESMVRSLNNLLEHLHQSFFFYLLLTPERFVSIGAYLSSAMLVAGNFTVMAVSLWIQSGLHKAGQGEKSKNSSKGETTGEDKVTPADNSAARERSMALPLTLVGGLHFLGLVPLYLFNTLGRQHLEPAVYAVAAISLTLPVLLAVAVWRVRGGTGPTAQELMLTRSFALLLLGLFLSTLATLNYALALLVGMLCVPLTYAGAGCLPGADMDVDWDKDGEADGMKTRNESAGEMNLGDDTTGFRNSPPSSSMPGQQGQQPSSQICRRLIAAAWLLLLNVLAPTTVLAAVCTRLQIPVADVLAEAAFGWHVWGMRTQVVVWCVWWPAWMAGAFAVTAGGLVV